MSRTLEHVHYPDAMPKLANQWIGVSSKRIVISKDGTKCLVADFSGCLGVVMSGTGKWGAVAHLHQGIQWAETAKRDQEWALRLVADFVRKKTGEQILDVLLYYGEARKTNPQADEVKEWMRCQRVIDRRRSSDLSPWGNSFVYYPGQKFFCTTAYNSYAGNMLDDNKEFEPEFQKFPFEDYDDKVDAGLKKQVAEKGYYIDGG